MPPIDETVIKDAKEEKQRIGQLLLKHTSLTEDQLEEALEMQKESKLLIGDILLKKNYIKTHDLVKVVCMQMGIPYIDKVNVDEIDPSVTNNVPIAYAKKHEVLPILETDYSVTVIMDNPFDFNVINTQSLLNQVCNIFVNISAFFIRVYFAFS